MLLAEELEVDVDAIRIEPAPVGDAYINPGNGGQVTGTSNSVQDAWDKLRTAGAQARTLLISAAADRWRVDPAQCHARNGRVVNAQGKSLTYGELADSAAKRPLPKDVKLKARSDFEIIGKPRPRLDSAAKVDGSAEFGLDVKLPGMLYAALAQSPVLGGKVRTVDAGAAEKMPGVRRVMTTASGVVVVAEHFWQALKARKALKIEWEPGANSGLDNAAIGALLKKAAAAGAGLSAKNQGDVPGAFKSARHSLSAAYELPLLAHATMEPMNCTADVSAGGCDLYVGTQVQQVSQATAAAAAGLEPAQVRVHTTLLGGGFGRRLDIDFIPAAVEASKAMGAPVKVIWTREDDMTHDTYRPPAYEEVSGGLDASGRLVAWNLHIVSPSITARMFPPVKGVDDSVIEAAVNNLYDVPNLSVSYSRQEIGIDVGYMRSVSHAPNCFVIESFMDELAALAGKNPYDFRMAHLTRKPRQRRVLQDDRRACRLGQGAGGTSSGHGAAGGLYHAHRASGRNFHRGGRTQGAQDHLRRRLRPDDQSSYRRVADRKRHRLRSVRSAMGRGHPRRRPGAANQFQQLSAAAQQRTAAARHPPIGERRNTGRHRRGRRALGCAGHLQCDIHRHGLEAALIADRHSKAIEGLKRRAPGVAETPNSILAAAVRG